ncbi:MAG TPA: septum formation protein Maf [Bacteroidales bacterium]|nr:septum formation protein Maf [Bacteroidales bacterium]
MKITNYKVLLASNSPRRKELLQGIDIDFEIKVLPDIDESYPASLPVEEVAEFIAEKKASSYTNNLKEDELLITADTVVILDGAIFGKPNNKEEANAMLTALSGKAHRVISGVCLATLEKQISFSVTSEVLFSELSSEEIEYYIDRYSPFDKAGSYGIQEWIGYIGVEHLSGSYFNIMGLPIQRLYRELKNF